MPCTAKKFEAQREELSAAGYPDVDLVLTTREIAKMIQAFGIDFPALPDGEFDHPLGISTWRRHNFRSYRRRYGSEPFELWRIL